MRYAKIRQMDVSNGEGIRVSLFVQGCNFHCKGCFNPETWSFNSGKLYTEDTKNTIIELATKPYIVGLSILGGEPLHPQNIDEVTELARCFKEQMPNKDIWLWSGFTYEEYISSESIINYVDYIVDGQFHINERDLSLKFKGSANQRVIDVKKTKEMNRIVIYEGTKSNTY